MSTWGYCGIDGNVAAPGNFSMACQWTKYLSAHYFILAHAKAYRIYDLEFRWRQKGSADWLGINYYYAFTVGNRTEFPYGIPQEQRDGATVRHILYPFPDGLRSLLNYCSQTYKVPLIVTENGYSDSTGTLNDTTRINYIRDHIIAVLQAREEGSNVEGYTIWSLMDNMEWASGYTVKYGLYNVDFTDPNRTRTPKASAVWYQQVNAQHSFQKCV
uniref:Beta-glucosidase n=1 Tax=Acrobeloides nanus TaxID=290746 RepID=A0A914CA11_9BILA